MNVEIGTETAQFLYWESIGFSLQCNLTMLERDKKDSDRFVGILTNSDGLRRA
jgi:hypothetical protein